LNLIYQHRISDDWKTYSLQNEFSLRLLDCRRGDFGLPTTKTLKQELEKAWDLSRWLVSFGRKRGPQSFDSSVVRRRRKMSDPAGDAPAATIRIDEAVHDTKKSTFGQGPEARYDLSFTDIVVSVASKNLQLVKGVSGKIKSGSVLCVLGPSGCGKSTLLECLANLRRPNLRVTGSILFNQQRLSSSQRRQIVSFCSQDHSLMGEFTVEETLRCTARLYFGYRVSSTVIEEKIKRVMQSVGLTESAKVRVGNLFFSGLSGGQKRRLAIGVELMASPSVIILDEPTSGLDSSASLGIMKLMQDLAKQGHTILASIHQPSSKIWSMMEEVMFMSRGMCMYFGPSDQLTSYLHSIRLDCPPTFSDVDFFTGTISTDFDMDAASEEEHVQDEVEQGQVMPIVVTGDRLSQVESLAKLYLDSEYNSYRFLSTTDEGNAHSPSQEASTMFGSSFKSAGMLPNTITLLHRNIGSVFKNPGTLFFRIAFGVGLGLVFGTMYFGIGEKSDEVSLFGRTSVVCGGIMFFAFLGVTSIPFVMEERATFIRERSNGMYRTSSYLLAKVLIMIPVSFCVTMAGSLLIVYMCKLRDFGTFFLTMWMAVLCSEGFIQFFGAVFDSYEAGMGIAICFYTLFFLTAGFFVVFDRISWAIRWVGYISPFRYSFHAGMRSEFEGVTELPMSVRFSNGSDVLRFYQIEGYGGVQTFWGNMGVLVALFACYVMLTFIALERRSK